MWNKRYSSKEYVYGKEPNVYLKEKLKNLPSGAILFAAEGEGRNAVFAATKGWVSTAFDSSKEGKKKAELLAQQMNVQIDYRVCTAEEFEEDDSKFDALALIYAHFPENRKENHRKLTKTIKKDGFLILEAFNKEHIENQKVNPQAGGPKSLKMLYDLDEIKEDFEGFEFLEAHNAKVFLKEGENHVGEADVVRLFGVKK